MIQGLSLLEPISKVPWRLSELLPLHAHQKIHNQTQFVSMHSTVGDMLRTLCRQEPPQNVATAIKLVDSALASAQYGLQTAVHRTLGISPGALVFQRDMLLPIPVLSDYNLIRQRHQTVINDNNRRENLRRRYRDYTVGDKVLLLIQNPATLQKRSSGPFIVEQVHTNGTLTVQRAPNVFDRINIRRLRPYVRPRL
jgi:hypothetical protein